MNVERNNVLGKQQTVKTRGKKCGWDPKEPRVTRERGEWGWRRGSYLERQARLVCRPSTDPDSRDPATLVGPRG